MEPHARIRREIARLGPIGFDRYMELALYGPGGYYQRGGALIGTPASYYTSPALTPAFGALVARQLAEMWVELGCPDPFTIVESGAANGRLARDIMAALQTRHADCAVAVRYVVVDIADTVTAAPETLSRVRAAGVPFRDLVGCVLANELWDNLPFQRWRRTAPGWQELRVDVTDQGFVERLGPPSLLVPGVTVELASLAVGSAIEVRPALDRWLTEAAGALKRGYVLAFDYGFLDAVAFWQTHRRGSALSYWGQAADEDWFAAPGSRDITAHVDLAAALAAAQRAGFDGARITTQADFLKALGLGSMFRSLSGMGLDTAVRVRNEVALRALVRPGGLGGFAVVCLARGGARLDLRGFGARFEASEPEAVPLAGEGYLDLTR